MVATIEARMASSRLPGKVLAEAAGKPMLQWMIERLRFVSELDAIVIATTTNSSDDPVEALGARLGVGVWRGSEDDVLSRVLDAATKFRAETIVELTGDCPLVDPRVVSRVIQRYGQAGFDYVSNCLEQTYPLGMEAQVFATSVLSDVAGRTSDPVDREHVSLYIYRHPELYSCENVAAFPSEARQDLRLTLDTREDLEVIRFVLESLGPMRCDFSLEQIIACLDSHPEIAALNAAIVQRHV